MKDWVLWLLAVLFAIGMYTVFVHNYYKKPKQVIYINSTTRVIGTDFIVQDSLWNGWQERELLNK